MTNDQATELSKRIINTMRPTPALGEWLEVLAPLNLDDALITFKTFRDQTDTGLPIGRFLGAYHGRIERRRAASTAPPPACERCSGTGFVEITDDRRHGYGCSLIARGTCFCHAVEPCACTVGQRVTPGYQRTAEHNARHRPPAASPPAKIAPSPQLEF